MDVLVLLAVVFSIAVVLRRSTRRARAKKTLHQVRDAAMAHHALNENADAFTNRPAGIFPAILGTGRRRGERNETIVTAPHGAHWRSLRCNLTAGILHPSRIASLAPLQQEASQTLLAVLSAKIQGEASVVIRADINAATFSMVARMCFGDNVDVLHVRYMEAVMHDLLDTVGGLIPVFDGSWLAQLVHWRQLRRLMGFLGRQTELYLPLIEARRQPSSRACCGRVPYPYVDSLLDLRIPDASGGGRRVLRNDELVSLLSEFLGAGSGSIMACLEWTLAHLIGRPEVQVKLRSEIDGETNHNVVSNKSLRSSMPYMHAVVLESLRMHPPAPFILRGVHGDRAEAIGARAPAADALRVQFVLGDIGRDSKTWTDPDEFRPERFLAGGEAEGVGPYPGTKEVRMMPFGTAHRHCPGTSLAMLQIKCLLAMLVREFEWAPSPEQCGPGGIDMTEHDGFFKVMKKPLCARVTRRRNEEAV
jgi:cytochrome P450